MHLSFSIPLLVGTCALGLLLLDRTRLKAQIRSLSRHQVNTDSTLSQFMQECERTLDEFSRLCLSGNVFQPARQGKFRRFSHSLISPSGVQTAAGHGVSEEEGRQTSSKQPGPERKQQILRLAGKGASVSEIANQLRMPRGEVDLIVSLSQDLKVVGGKS